ncbi:MAG: hypothetical protein ABSA07_07115 [Acidimicrobiales bacterium]
MTLVAPTHSKTWWRPLPIGDRRAVYAMVIVPTLLFVLPALFGHPAIDGDNLIQNFPLRVLSGEQIATGHLPLFNPLANSGTPLLGGLNAGALYPGTVVFAFLPPIAAWLVNCVAVYVIAATGMFALLRWHGMRTLSSFAASMSFAYSGAMIGQLVHLGVVQGFAFIPWAALIIVSLSRRLSLEPASSSWRHYARVSKPWIWGYALLWGLTFLTGEPRGIAEIELLTLTLGPSVLLIRSSYWIATWRARVAYVVALAAGLAWGIAIGLVQLLPGWSFIGYSQRSSVSYGFFGAGSLVVRWTSLLFVPDIFGGNGAAGQPNYFAHYNLPEVTGYAGLLALIAAFAFVAKVTRRGWKGEDRDYVLYFVVVVVGLFATWGSYTPLGHLFRDIPLYGSTRLQSRNVVMVDFAMAALLGWWFNRIQTRRTDEAGLEGRRRWVTLAPAFAVIALCGGLFFWGDRIVSYLGVFPQQEDLAQDMHLSYGLHLAIAVVAVSVLIRWRSSKDLMKILMAVLVADVVVFLVLSATGLIGGSGPTEPSRTHAVALFGTRGRTALVDQGGAHQKQFQALGVPNMNVFTKEPSVQGYGSLISTIYDNSTGTHPQSAINPCRLADGTFTQLRLAAIAVSYAQLSHNVNVPVTPAPNCRMAPASQIDFRYFGQVLRVHSIRVHGRGGHPIAYATLYLSLVDAHGQLEGPPILREAPANQMTFIIPGPARRAAGFELSSLSPISVGDTKVSQLAPIKITYDLNSPLQEALDGPNWRLSDTVGTFSVFKAGYVQRSVTLTSSNGTVSHVKNASYGDTWVDVDAHGPVTLVRSMAYLPGWRATALNATTGRSEALKVTRDGLIQQVTVPSGRWRIHFHYHAPYIELSLAASIVGSVLIIGVGAYLFIDERRRREDKVRS